MRRCLNCMSEYLDQYEDRCPHCGYIHGTTQRGAADLTPGSILQGRYIVGTAIRSRDTDIFYNGWDALFDRRVIIQEYFPKYCAARSANSELSVYESKADIYKQGLDLFYSDSRELIRFYKDENVITYHACFQANKTAYAVMEHRNYKTLREWLDKRDVDSREAVDILRELIRITEMCHQKGIIHGMIDLDAVWMTGEGRLVLKDFGAWRYISGEPGIVNYRNACAAADVYRLAVLFCQMITGAVTEDAEVLTAELNKKRFRLKNQEVQALKHALAHDIEDLHTFHRELEGAAAKQTSSKRTKRRDAKEPLSLPKWAWAAAAAAAVLVLAVTVVSIRRIRLEAEKKELEQTEVRVPNVVGKDADQVETMLRSMGLKMEREQMNYSDEIAEDMISFQTPQVGAVLKKGDSVVVQISKGKEKADIPLVKGLDEEEAKKLLEEAGFHQVSILEAPESQLKYGTVLTIAVEEEGTEKPKEMVSIIDQLLGGKLSESSQKKEDNLVALDAKIVLTVSRHKLQPEEIEVTIPLLVGGNLEEAQNAVKQITEKELILQPQEEYSERPVGEVISQTPEAGSVTTESYVTIVVSKGREKVAVKNVELLEKDEAVKELERLGLNVGTIKEEYSDSVAKGKVISQSVNGSELLEKGSVVELVISKGAKPEAKPQPTKPAKKEMPKATAAPKPTRTPETEAETTKAEPTEAEMTEAESKPEETVQETKQEPTQAESRPEASEEPISSNSKENAIEAGILIEPNPNGPGAASDSSDSKITVGEGPGQ